MPDVGVLQLSIQDNSSQAAEGLGKLVSVLESIKGAVNIGSKMGTVARNIEKLAKVVDENITGSTISKLNELCHAFENLQGIGAINIRINYGKDGSIREAAATVQETQEMLSQSVGDGFANAPQSIAEVTTNVNELKEASESTGTSFKDMLASFDPSKLPISILGMTVEQLNNGSVAARAMQDVLKDTEDVLMRMKPSADLQTFTDNEPKGLILYNENIENSWENIASRIKEANQNLEEQKAQAWELDRAWGQLGYGSIMPLLQSNDWLGQSLRGLNGLEQQIIAIQTVMTGTGLSFPNIAQQIYEATGGFVDLNEKIYGLSTAEKQAESSTSSLANRISDLKARIKEWNESTKESGQNLGTLSSAFSGIGNGIKALLPTISSFASSLMRIAKYRVIRSIIKQITQGFKEGIENVYHYSEAINSSFAPSMDSASATLLQMKNSLGAAAAPLLQSLIPILQTIVNWFITLVNYVNQFIALMRGQATWTKAVPTTSKAFDSVEKGAKKAGSALKDLLADWDELNIIQSESGGTGSGTGTDAMTDYLNMFEEVSEFNNRIKTLVDGIKDKFGSIWNLVKKIGLGILGWKFANAFTGVLGTLGGLLAGATTMKLLFDIVTMFDENYLKTGDDGWLIGNVLTTLIGSVLMEKILSKVLGGAYAELAIPITLSVSALADIITLIGNNNVSAISEESLKLSTLSALKAATAATYIGLKTGAGVGASLAGGAVAALLTFGTIIGIKAIARAQKGEITEETVKSAAISSTAISLGSALFAKLVGSSTAVAMGIGAGAGVFTLFTIAAAIGIKAYLHSQKSDIIWGDLSLTESQVKDFVDDELFEAGFNAKLELINATVSVLPSVKNDVETQAAGLFKTLNILKLGVDEENSLAEIKKQIFGESEDGSDGLMGKFRALAKEQKNLVETSITLVPIKNEQGKDVSKDIASKSIEGWDILEQEMDRLGASLNEHLVNSMNSNLSEELRKYEQNAAAEIIETMARVSRAAAFGQTSGKAEVEFTIGLENLSRESMGEAVALYKEYIEKAKDEYIQLTTETAASFKSQSAAFAELAASTTDPELKKYYESKAKEYLELFEFYKKQAIEGVEDATKTDREKGHDVFVEWMKNNFQFGEADFTKSIDMANGGAAQLVKQYMGNVGLAIRENNGEYTDEVKDQMNNLFDAMLQSVLEPEDYKVISEAVSAGLLDYTDIFGEDVLQQIINWIGKDEYYGDAIRQAWHEMLEEALSNREIPTIENEVNVDTKVNETIEEATGGATTDTVTEQVNTTAEEVKDVVDEVKELGEEAVEAKQNILTLDDIKLDTKGVESSANDAASAIENMARRIRDAFATLDGLSYEMDISGTKYSGAMSVLIPNIEQRASGGFIKSGDLIMANENGNIEMMGKMGNQPVVANNQQIVSGITQGVSQANTGVESRLGAIETMLTRILQKEFVARAVPSSGWGQHGAQSADAWNKVTG